jgi:oxalate decarboxylase/phosphoglucose isomerase-like protein (cupin superfamily)
MLADRLKRTKHSRDDGWLAEIIPMNSPDHPFHGVHSYIVSITPGRSRANHYHTKKEEWIALASGNVVLVLEDTGTKERETIVLDSQSDEYSVIHIPSFIAHSVQNPGSGEASVVVFSRTPEDTADTFPYIIEM